MIIYPAIDIYEGKAVRLFKGDYAQMTVYNDDPAVPAMDFTAKGAEWIHMVDLEGAKKGTTPNLETICRVKEVTGLKCQVGGGIRNMETVSRYLDAGLDLSCHQEPEQGQWCGLEKWQKRIAAVPVPAILLSLLVLQDRRICRGLRSGEGKVC